MVADGRTNRSVQEFECPWSLDWGALQPKLPGRPLTSPRRPVAADQRRTRALPPFINASTSARVAMLVSPGVVMASAPWAAP